MARSKKYYKRKYKKYYRKKYYYSRRTSPRRSWRFCNDPSSGGTMVKFRASTNIPMSTDTAGYSYVSYIHPMLYNYNHLTIAGELLPLSMIDDVPSMQFFKFYDQWKINGIKIKLTFPAPIGASKTAHLCYDWIRSATFDEFDSLPSTSGMLRVNETYLNNSVNQVQLASSAKNSVTLKLYPKGAQERGTWMNTTLGTVGATVFTNVTTSFTTIDDFWANRWQKPPYFWPMLKFGVTNDAGGYLPLYCLAEMTCYVQFRDFSPQRVVVGHSIPYPIQREPTKTVRDAPEAAAESTEDMDPTQELVLDPEYQETLRQERLELASKRAKERVLLDRKLKRTD